MDALQQLTAVPWGRGMCTLSVVMFIVWYLAVSSGSGDGPMKAASAAK